jgi:hypothetical protein
MLLQRFADSAVPLASDLCCFPKPELRNFKSLILIVSRAHARGGGKPRKGGTLSKTGGLG